MRCRYAIHFDAIRFSLRLFHRLGGKLDHLQVLQLQVGSESVEEPQNRSAPLATRHRRRSPQPISTYRLHYLHIAPPSLHLYFLVWGVCLSGLVCKSLATSRCLQNVTDLPSYQGRTPMNGSCTMCQAQKPITYYVLYINLNQSLPFRQ